MKRLYYFIAACLLCIFLAACGDKNTVTQKPDISGPALSPTGQADPGKDPTPTQGLADNYITSHRHVSVHDPSVEYDNGKYYIFGSHLACAVTEDLVSWNYVKNSNSGYSKNNGLFKTYDTVFAKPGDYVGGTDQLWAPDVIYNKAMGKYCMYMSVSGTTCMSCIALAVSDSIEGPYEYVDTILYSGFTTGTVGKTDVLKVLGVNSLSETPTV